MADRLRPATADQLREAVAWAATERTPTEIVGAGTKRALGRPFQSNLTIDLSALSGVIDYEPAELVITAHAGTPLSTIETMLAEANQQLAFEPPDWGPLLGMGPDGATLGGVLASNMSGPRRLKAGAARDHFLGFEAVSGRGEVFKSGSRVVKNVTGYDLCKLMAGSYGTLAVLAQVNVKVLPAPEKTRTVLLLGLDDAAGCAVLREVARSPYEPSGLAHLPASVAAASAVSYVRDAGTSVTAIRLEGTGASVEYRCRMIRDVLAGRGRSEELHSTNSVALWRELRDVSYFVADQSRVVWKLSVAPTDGPAVAVAIAAGSDAVWFYDWAGGLIWLSLPRSDDAGAALVRGAVTSGHATLIRADADTRADAARGRVHRPVHAARVLD